MKFTTAAIFLLGVATSIPVAALQTPKAFGVAAVAASALVGAPLNAPAALDTPETALVLTIQADIDPFSAAKNLFAHRSQLQDAVKDFLSSAQKLGQDLDGVFPPPPQVTVVPPTQVKQAVLDALAGQARLVVNGEPVYFEVDSQEGFFTFKVLSPILPKLPFLEPTDEQRASMVIPRPPATVKAAAVVVDSSSAATSAKAVPFWEWSYQIPVVNKDVTLAQATEAFAGLVVAAYVTSYGYYVVSQALEEQQAEAKKQSNLEKQATAAKKKKEAAAVAAAAVDTTAPVVVENIPPPPASDVAMEESEEVESDRKSILPWKK